MALLKIRSDMDLAFRDSTPKAPLWEQVSRKLEEVGYHRSAKKCKEKFENIYKYHRRTKEGRCGKSNAAKTYRFFEQLEALDHSLPQPDNNDVHVVIREAHAGEHSSSTTWNNKSRKMKMTQFLEALMREVIEKQEVLQKNFMEVLDKCERERLAREEAWKKEELARIKRERELLAQERSIAAAKDEAVLAFLRKFAEAQGTVQLLHKIQVPNKDMQQNGNDVTHMDKHQECGNVAVGSLVHVTASRWPKDEVEALIRLRTQLEVQSQGNNNNNNDNNSTTNNNGSKGPLWEEISLAMKSLGYDRSAKRCKEKWENINKYFKRMKEKNKRKPQDSKTCPYYHHLEALYSKRPKKVDESGGCDTNNNSSGNELKPEELLLHIMESQEERQQQQQQHMDESSSEDAERENTDQNEDQSGYQNQTVDNSPASIAIMS
uniref:Myb-like domain-containing protein n=2 Tax=Cajanus cajan TaxID=3821 RepID=A0A151TQR6_CAJCA|nr:hypothetical protein KK1_008592 [Cajanus cajan]